MSNSMKENRLSVLRAWGVHLYTAMGLVLALLGVNAIVEKKATMTILFMSLAMLIDATDGNMARRWQVKKWTPQFDGRKLDDIVDYLTYTFIPVFFMYQFNVVSWPWAVALFGVLLASVYGFCLDAAKTGDGFFTGFPSYWNVVALYLYLLDWPQWASGLAIVALILLTFVPSKYISLNQTIQLRRTHRLFFLAWVVFMIAIVAIHDRANVYLVYLSLAYPAYYFAASFYLNLKTKGLAQTT